jgi:hypothetical protein
MKAKILGAVFMLIWNTASAALPEGETIRTLYGDTITSDGRTNMLPPLVTAGFDNPPNVSGPGSALILTYTGNTPVDLLLLPLNSGGDFADDLKKIVTHHFAIVGEARYENISAGSYLEMRSEFASPAPGYPIEVHHTRTLDPDGPMGRLDGTSDWRKFWLRLDAAGTRSQLIYLQMFLHLTGPGTVHLRNMKLVQYPDALPASNQSSSSPEAQVIAEQMSSSPEGQTVKTLPWNLIIDGQAGGIPMPPHVKTEVEESSDPDNPLAFPLKITYDGPTELQLKLLPSYHDWQHFNESFAHVVTHHFAIVGEVRYEKVSPESYLEIWSHFASPAPGYPEAAYFSRTLGEDGPMGKLEGTHDWREFRLPFDATGAKTKLVQLEMNLHLTGPGTVHLRNMRLVQYPDEGVGSPIHIPVESTRTTGIDWKSFLLGMAATGASLLVGGGIIFISRRWNRRRHERELRRIASLDS